MPRTANCDAARFASTAASGEPCTRATTVVGSMTGSTVSSQSSTSLVVRMPSTVVGDTRTRDWAAQIASRATSAGRLSQSTTVAAKWRRSAAMAIQYVFGARRLRVTSPLLPGSSRPPEKGSRYRVTSSSGVDASTASARSAHDHWTSVAPSRTGRVPSAPSASTARTESVR